MDFATSYLVGFFLEFIRSSIRDPQLVDLERGYDFPLTTRGNIFCKKKDIINRYLARGRMKMVFSNKTMTKRLEIKKF